MPLNKHGASYPSAKSNLPEWVNFGLEPALFSWFDHGIPIRKKIQYLLPSFARDLSIVREKMHISNILSILTLYMWHIFIFIYDN